MSQSNQNLEISIYKNIFPLVLSLATSVIIRVNSVFCFAKSLFGHFLCTPCVVKSFLLNNLYRYVNKLIVTLEFGPLEDGCI